MSFLKDFYKRNNIRPQNIKGKIAAIGQTVIDLNLEIDKDFSWESVIATKKTRHIGGSALNTLRTVNNLGIKTEFFSVFGREENSNEIINKLKEEGIGTNGANIEDNFECALAIVLNSPKLAKKTIFLNKNNTDYKPKEILPEILEDTKFIHFNGLYPFFTSSVLNLISRNNTKISLNCGLGPQSRVAFEQIPTANIIVASNDFCLKYFPCGEDDFRNFFFSNSLDPQVLVITNVANGGVFFHSNKKHAYIANNANVINTTGSGDAFHAGLLFALAQNLDIFPAIELASWLGARCCETDAPVYFL